MATVNPQRNTPAETGAVLRLLEDPSASPERVDGACGLLPQPIDGVTDYAADELRQLVRSDPEQFVRDWSSDPGVDLAAIYRACETTSGDAELGRIIRAAHYEMRLRAAAAVVVEQQS
ncbi:MAG: hypothetical protein JWM53_5871 [bacterium]|nr:hypothetical protein [bacterium]